MKNNTPTFGKETALPLQKLLEGDFMRIRPLHENINSLSVVPHRHDHYELLYITEGQGSHYINYKAYDVIPGRIYFLHPGQVHLINNFKRKGWIIMFGQELFARFLDIHRHEDETGLLDSYTSLPYTDPKAQQKEQFEALIQLALVQLAAPKQDAALLLHYAALLLLHANRMHTGQHQLAATAPGTRAVFYRLKQLIESNFKTQHLADYYAGQLSADIKKLNRISREITGFTVAALIRERLVTESKVRLQTSAQSVKEISYDLGFNDPAFFGRFFKQHTGFTPAQFRNLSVV